MTSVPTNQSATAKFRSRRQWRNRQPASKRLDLSPAEAEAKEAEREAGKRSVAVHFQVTAAEKATITRRSKKYGLRPSDFARKVLLSDFMEPLRPATDPEAVRALAFQLSKLGTNLNQLAKIANETHKIKFEAELRALSAKVADALGHVIEL